VLYPTDQFLLPEPPRVKSSSQHTDHDSYLLGSIAQTYRVATEEAAYTISLASKFVSTCARKVTYEIRSVITLSVLVMACAQVGSSHVHGINDMDADAHFFDGFAYQNSGRYNLAIDAYTRPEQGPRHAGHSLIGACGHNQRNYAKAIGRLQ